MDSLTNEFLGTGWKFPVEFSVEETGAVMVTGRENIQNSLEVLFSTKMGERIMHPDYGSELDNFVFEPLNTSIITYMKVVVSDAILFNEPRIVLNDVEIESLSEDSSYLIITIDYTIAATNSRYNFVYPFYFNDATNLPV